MKSALYLIAGCFLLSTSAAHAVIDQNPLSAGTTQTRNAGGNASEAVFHNPALLGVERAPSGGLQLTPLMNIAAGYWSDKLAISPFNLPPMYTKDSSAWPTYLNQLLIRSFNITQADLDDTTGIRQANRLAEAFKGGFTVYSGFRTSLLNITQRPFALDVTTHFDEQLHVPEAALDMAFMLYNNSLQRGGMLDFSDFTQEGIWATDITLHCGLPVAVPALSDLLHLRYGAGGLGLKYVMGHSILRAQTTSGKMYYDDQTNSMALDATLDIQTAGLGLHSNFPFNRYDPKDMMPKSLPINGHGIGIDIGGILYDDNSYLSINVENLGVLFWLNDVKQATYSVKAKDLTFYDIYRGINDAGSDNPDSAALLIFNRNNGDYVSTAADSLHESNGFVTVLPLTLNIGYSYTWPLAATESGGLKWLSDHVTFSANYEQSLTENPGYSYIPRLSLGGEVGTLNNFFPLRVGFILGGAEKLASTLGGSFNFKYFSLNGAYKAVGNPLFYPTRGIEVAVGMTVNWGMKDPGHGEKPAPIMAYQTDTFTVHDTTVRVDTLQIHDTTMVHDTVVQIKTLPTEKEQKALAKALRGVNFQTASAELTSDSYTYLIAVVNYLKQYSYLRYEIQGHTDAVGNAEVNLLLSAARANTVRNYLVSQEVADSNLIAIGYGKTKPIASNSTAAGRARNRRVEFVAVETEDEYQRLRALEADTKIRLMETEIKGMQY